MGLGWDRTCDHLCCGYGVCGLKVKLFLAWPRGYKTFFMLNSTEHEISTAHKKLKYGQMKKFLALSLSDVVFIMLTNVKMPTIVGILTFMSRINFMLI